jgi:hypothetical protein
MPLTLHNMTGLAWYGVKFTIGFGTYVINNVTGKLDDQFMAAGTTNLDFDFNKKVVDGKATKDLVIDPNGQNATDTGQKLITTTHVPDTFRYIDTTGNNRIPNNNRAGTFQWSVDVPNWDKIPEMYHFTDKDLNGNNIDAYRFTIRISPLSVPEPSSLVLCVIALTLGLAYVARQRALARNKTARSGGTGHHCSSVRFGDSA